MATSIFIEAFGFQRDSDEPKCPMVKSIYNRPPVRHVLFAGVALWRQNEKNRFPRILTIVNAMPSAIAVESVKRRKRGPGFDLQSAIRSAGQPLELFILLYEQDIH